MREGENMPNSEISGKKNITLWKIMSNLAQF